MTEYEKTMEALNRIDEFASAYTIDNNTMQDENNNDIGEAEQLEKDYNLVADFIKIYAKNV